MNPDAEWRGEFNLLPCPGGDCSGGGDEGEGDGGGGIWIDPCSLMFLINPTGLCGGIGGPGTPAPLPGGGGGVNTAGGSAPTSLANIQQFSTDPWSPLAGALAGTKCGGTLQNAFSNSPYGAGFKSLNDFLTSSTGLWAVTGSATFIGGTASAITSNNAMMSGDLVMINAAGAYYNPLPSGYVIGPSDNKSFQTQISAINGGTPEAQAFLLLHELFHVLGLFQPDSGNQTAQSQNNTLMWFNCGSVIQGFSNK